MKRYLLASGLLIVSCVAEAIATPDSSRPLRQMRTLYDERGAYEISVDNDPAWIYTEGVSGSAPALFLAAPPLVVPPIAMAVINNEVTIHDDEKLRAVRRVAFAYASKQYGSTSDKAGEPAPAAYGHLSGEEVAFEGTVEGSPVDVLLFIGSSPSGVLFTLHAYTSRGKHEHLAETVRRIWGSIEFDAPPGGPAKSATPSATQGARAE